MSDAIPLLSGTLSLRVEEAGDGPAVLLLHGGAGPASMRPLLGGIEGRRTLLPTIPGFDGTPQPDWLRSVPDLATAYLALLDALALDGVLVAGNSVGGWIAAEMAARRPSRLAGLVLVDSVGLEPTAETGDILNPLTLPAEERPRWSFHDPDRFAQPPSPEGLERMAANGRVLNGYAGDPFMHDPGLGARLRRIAVPTAVLWGVSDRIVGPDYGRALAALVPGASFEEVPEAGHFPQIERPDAVAAAIRTLG